MKRTRTVMLLAALVMTLALAAACGASAKDRLQSYVDASKPQVEGLNKAMGGSQKDATWDAAAATLDAAAKAIGSAADGFGSITAPDALKSAHEQLIVGLRDIEKAFHAISAALKDGTFGPATMNDAALNKLLNDGSAKRKAWKAALEKQCKDLGVTINWKWG
jgi:hypothetical protein